MDYANKVIPGKMVEGYKQLKKMSGFKVHWPGDPNMPGMLQVESMVQMSSLIILTLPGMKGKTLYLAESNNIKFYKKIIPGDKLKIFSKLLSSNRGLFKFEASGYVKKILFAKQVLLLFCLVLSI